MIAVATPPKPAPLLVQPMLNERQDAFVERADRTLRKSIPDRNSRMSAIAQAWSRSGAEARLQQRAREALASVVDCRPDQIDQFYVTRPNRPIFPEHQTTGPDGSVQRYDRAALAAIVDRCNRRILDTGDLAALSAGHTPTPEQQARGMPMPDLVGFSGPFRLGIIGDDAPRWCIFADEHVFKDDFPRVQKMPRRSPEVWLEPRMADRVMDPIAVLGSETPRLDTGIGRFSRGARRLDAARYTNVARYSMSMGAMPSGSNTFTQKYGAAEQTGAMDDQSLQAIVEAVLQGIAATPQWAWLTDQMQTSQNPTPESEDQGPTASADASQEGVTDPMNPTGTPGDPGLMNDGTSPGGAASADAAPPADTGTASMADASASSPADGTPPEASTSPTDNTGTGATPEEMASMSDDEKQEYSRLSPTHQDGYMLARRRHCKPTGTMQYANPTERERYSRLESENKNLRGENAALRAERTYRARYGKLQELSQSFEVEPDEEMTDCNGMTDAQFEKHCERIVAKYSRRDPNGGMPNLVLPPLETQKTADESLVERYSRRAIQISTESKGRVGWEEAYQQAKAEIDRKTAV